jgi:hypothetical protein
VESSQGSKGSYSLYLQVHCELLACSQSVISSWRAFAAVLLKELKSQEYSTHDTT